jgi:hypothetical protein
VDDHPAGDETEAERQGQTQPQGGSSLISELISELIPL